MTQTESFKGGLSNVVTHYNALGQVQRVSRPYFGGGSVYWTDYEYDDIGRVSKEISPITGVTSRTYTGLTTIVTNAKSQVTREIKDARGQTIRTVDALNRATTYDYDPAGNLTRVTDSAGNATINVYDVRGHKIQTTDPDMGVWTYDYNVLGELIEQRDAKDQVTRFTYDKLGRMTERVEPDGVATWVYDTAFKGKGQLASEKNPGFSRSYNYDDMGRLAGTTTTIDGLEYTSSQSYDAASRVKVITYPTGFEVQNAYNEYGYLERVHDPADPNLFYWQGNGANAEGKLTNETLGNGLVTTRIYDAASGRLQTILSGGGSVQYLKYDFDTLGNLESREDQAQGFSETFGYDALNRLTEINTVAGGTAAPKAIGYDALCNITHKTDMGAYAYDAVRPHVVTQAGEHTYTHDANGNMVSGADRTFTWNSANLPTKLTRGNSAAYFHYGSDRSRFKQVLTGSGSTETTRYVGGLYEQVNKGSLTTRRHHIYANGQLVALRITRSSGDSDTRYVYRDHLGSIDTFTRVSGEVVERLSYDAWGRRRSADWRDPEGQISSSVMPRGFTGHEHLDEARLIHMNGRVYYPGRFIAETV